MQTFLPYPNFRDSAKVLDRQRLGKQRVEAYQIMRVLLGESDGWKNHPAVKMWRGYTESLALYGTAICDEWISRGYKDTLRPKFADYAWKMGFAKYCAPPWFGDEQFHASHRSNLLRKDLAWYSRFGWTEPNDLPYVWPKGD